MPKRKTKAARKRASPRRRAAGHAKPRGAAARSRKRARPPAPQPWSSALDSRHVEILPPPRGEPIRSEALVLALERVAIRRLLARERSAEGTLFITANGQRTALPWRGPGREAFEIDGDRELLFAGRPRQLLDLSVELIESDADERRWLARVKTALEATAGAVALLPGHGAAAASGLALAGALVDWIRAGAQDRVELRFLGSLGDLGAQAPRGIVPLRSGTYRLVRRGKGGDDEIELAFSAHPFEAPRIDPKQPVAIALERIELELDGVARGDTLLVDATFAGGGDRRSRRRRTSELHVAQRLHEAGAWLDRTLGIQNKLLYRGPWGEGVSFSLGVAVLRESRDAEIQALLQKAGAFTAHWAPEVEENVEAIAKAAEGIRAAVVKLLPEKRFAMSKASALTVGTSGRRVSGLYAIPDLNGWHRVAVRLKDPEHGRVTFHLHIGKDG